MCIDTRSSQIDLLTLRSLAFSGVTQHEGEALAIRANRGICILGLVDSFFDGVRSGTTSGAVLLICINHRQSTYTTAYLRYSKAIRDPHHVRINGKHGESSG